MAVNRITNPTHYTWLSTDAKPDRTDTYGVEEGSTAQELDTGRQYRFEQGHWKEIEPEPNWLKLIYEELSEIRELLETEEREE